MQYETKEQQTGAAENQNAKEKNRRPRRRGNGRTGAGMDMGNVPILLPSQMMADARASKERETKEVVGQKMYPRNRGSSFKMGWQSTQYDTAHNLDPSGLDRGLLVPTPYSAEEGESSEPVAQQPRSSNPAYTSGGADGEGNSLHSHVSSSTSTVDYPSRLANACTIEAAD
jgi:hypothetical protein